MLQLTHYHLLPTHNLPLSFTSIACYKEVDSEATHVRIADLFLHIVETQHRAFVSLLSKMKEIQMDIPLVDSESSIASPLAVTSSRESPSKSSLHWATMQCCQ